MTIDVSTPSYVVRGREYEGFLADGSEGRRAPCILVVHEGRGYARHAKDRSTMLAELGYVAYAPNYFIYDEDPMKMMQPFAEDRGLFREHGLGALEVLRKHANVDSGKLGAIGFCWGGYAVLELACHADLSGVVGFHPGLSLGALTDAQAIRAKVLVCVGEQDPYVPMSDIQSFIGQMGSADTDCQVLLLLGAPHSFANPDVHPGIAEGLNVGYDPVAHQRSWAAMERLFSEAF